MKILVVDGQGGGIGKNIVENLKKEIPEAFIIAVGTNSTATVAMKKAGANAVATGESPVIYNSKHVDYICGPIGIVFGNAMYGEISEKMANAISSSEAVKLLIPVTQCSGHVMGIMPKSIQEYVNELVEKVKGEA